MSQVLLSICIFTYNRPERISVLIKQIISFQSNEIEIVIGDDNPLSNRTRSVVQQFKDPRINYFHNKNNLGHEGNLLKTIHRASGKFVFLIVDDVDIEMEIIPWILKQIKKNQEISMIRGQINFKNPNSNNIVESKSEKRVLKKGFKSLNEILFKFSDSSGLVIKKSALNLKEAIKYNGFLHISQILEAQAMMEGDTLYTSKIFVIIGAKEYSSEIPKIKGRNYTHPLERLKQWKFRTQLVYNITKKNKKIRRIFINKHKNRIIYYFRSLNSLKECVEGLSIFITMKISKHIVIWNLLANRILYELESNKLNLVFVNYFKKKFSKKYNNIFLN